MDTRLPPFPVTRAAIDQLTAVGGTVRVDVTAGGCSGLTWTFEDVDPRDGDALFGCRGAFLAVSPAALPLLSRSCLDYGGRLRPPRYRVLGLPEQTCPCRRSFGSPWPGRGRPDCRARTPMPWDAASDPDGLL